MSKLFRVSSSITKSDTILLEHLLDTLDKTSSHNWQFVSALSSEIILIDVDEPGGLELYTQISSKADAPVVIALSSRAPESKVEYHLHKPIHSIEFMSVAKTVIDNHPNLGTNITKTGSFVSKIDNPTPDNQKTVTEEPTMLTKRPPHRRLYNLILEIQNTYKNPIEISYHGFSVIIDFDSKNFYTLHKLMVLSMLCKSNIDKLTITDLSINELHKIVNKLDKRPLSELIWCAVLLGTSDELLSNITENTKLHLLKWPDFDSLFHLPMHVRLSVFMTKHSVTLSEIAKRTQIPPKHIYGFANACLVTGLLDTTSIKAWNNNSEITHANSTKEIDIEKINNSSRDNATATQSKQPSSNGFKILIIDDSLIARKAAAKPLIENGFEIMEAKDGFDALGKLEKQIPDLIILDLIMPGIDGYKVVDLLKNNKKYKNLPIIMVTSKDRLIDKVKGKMSPTDAYLTKPFKDSLLLKTIGIALTKAEK